MNNTKRLVIVHSPKSTRSNKFFKINKYLVEYANSRQLNIHKIELIDIPYQSAVKKISQQLLDNDLVIAAGGDGVAQVSFNAVYSSNKQAIFATIPLGNSNDISRSFNKKLRSVEAILTEQVVDFYPLNIITDKKQFYTIASYITFGSTTVLVDFLNSKKGRKQRRLLKKLPPGFAIPLFKLKQISHKIDQLDTPIVYCQNKPIIDDSFGFFILSAAHNMLRLPKDIKLAASEFFFHQATTKNKSLPKKISEALRWVYRFPGRMTELEEIIFDGKQDIIANISGDNVNLGKIKKLSAIRSKRPVKILFNKNIIS